MQIKVKQVYKHRVAPLVLIILASKAVLSGLRFLILFVVLAALIFFLFVLIPVRSIPGNDFLFQLSIFTLQNWVLLGSLSFLTSLAIVMNIHNLMHGGGKVAGVYIVGQSSLAGVSGVVSSIFGAATCAACVASLFGFLGVGGVLFLIEYRTLITIGAILLMLVSLYFVSQKVLKVCQTCR